MEVIEAVRRLKSDLANHCYSGEASRLRGIVVSPEVWTALSEEEGFHGVVGVSGREGSRVIRYSFYILENLNFPRRSADPYFFVSYPKEAYQERYFEREDEILASENRRSKQILGTTFTELNPVWGVVEVKYPGSGGSFLYNVDYEEVVAVAEKSHAAGESPGARIASTFGRDSLVQNPPEWELDLNPANYDYDRADTASLVGRMFMQREPQGDGFVFQIVGIGKNGLGETVDVVMGDSRKEDSLEFARFALNIFLPEEIEEFFSSHGGQLPADWKEGVEVWEHWGQWHDRESLGRLSGTIWNMGSDRQKREMNGTFLSTRGKSYRLGISEESVGSSWEEFLTQHFPPDWKGWPETSQDRALDSMARAMSS